MHSASLAVLLGIFLAVIVYSLNQMHFLDRIVAADRGVVRFISRCTLILVWPTSWTASCTTLIVCVCVCVRACVRACVRVCVCVGGGGVCVSGDMSPYCSAHDEWLITKLCMYVRYHTAMQQCVKFWW